MEKVGNGIFTCMIFFDSSKQVLTVYLETLDLLEIPVAKVSMAYPATQVRLAKRWALSVLCIAVSPSLWLTGRINCGLYPHRVCWVSVFCV